MFFFLLVCEAIVPLLCTFCLKQTVLLRSASTWCTSEMSEGPPAHLFIKSECIFFFLFEREQCIHVHTVLFLNRYLLQDRGLIIDTPCTHEYSKLFSSISTTGFCFTYYCPVVTAKLTVIWFIWLCNFISVHFTLQELGKWKVGNADAFTSMKF